jgi:hypothetical protein
MTDFRACVREPTGELYIGSISAVTAGANILTRERSEFVYFRAGGRREAQKYKQVKSQADQPDLKQNPLQLLCEIIKWQHNLQFQTKYLFFPQYF